MSTVSILVINGSPRTRSNTAIVAADILDGIASVEGASGVLYTFAGKTFHPCKGSCSAYHRQHGNCVVQDHFQEFAEAWCKADGVVYACPVYHMAPPSAVRSAIERLGATYFGYGPSKGLRLAKAAGVLCQGNTDYGGQELAMINLLSHLLLMNCVPVTADKPMSYIGVGAQVDSAEQLAGDLPLRENARSLGRRVAEMALILQAGIKQYENSFGREYTEAQRTFLIPGSGHSGSQGSTKGETQ